MFMYFKSDSDIRKVFEQLLCFPVCLLCVDINKVARNNDFQYKVQYLFINISII